MFLEGFILSYDNSTAMYKDLKTLHPGGIRTQDIVCKVFVQSQSNLKLLSFLPDIALPVIPTPIASGPF
jgi:hypothetical protein